MRYPRLGQWLFCAALRHSVDGVYQYGLNCKSRRHENYVRGRSVAWRSRSRWTRTFVCHFFSSKPKKCVIITSTTTCDHCERRCDRIKLQTRMQEAAPGSPDCSYHSLSLQDTGELFSRISHSSRCQRGGEELVEERSFVSRAPSRRARGSHASGVYLYFIVCCSVRCWRLFTYLLTSSHPTC